MSSSDSYTSDDKLSDVSSEFSLQIEDVDEEPSFDGNPILGLNASPSAHGDGGWVEPYSDDPVATQEWTESYNREIEEEEARLNELRRRLDGSEPLSTWCRCGHCAIANLKNAKECKCCQEIERCVEALNDEIVVGEFGSPPDCITQHPGFRVVCLEPWSLRLSAVKYKTIGKKRYKQTGEENRFLRAVAYRQFTHLAHGYLGSKRISLPACAYDSIRRRFSIAGEQLVGYQDE